MAVSAIYNFVPDEFLRQITLNSLASGHLWNL